MAIFDKNFIDFMQSMGIAYSHSKMGTVEERIARLEKLVYELYKEIKKMQSSELKATEKKGREERIAKIEKDKKYHLNDCIIITKEMTVDGNVVGKGSKGIIDNILRSYGGIQYMIKLNENNLLIQITEDDFELEK